MPKKSWPILYCKLLCKEYRYHCWSTILYYMYYNILYLEVHLVLLPALALVEEGVHDSDQ